MLNIFCPYRNREKIYEDFIDHYKSFFPDSRIFMLEQADNRRFRRGQLMNVGFKELTARGFDFTKMLFVDLDIRLKYPIPFEAYLDINKKVVIPFNELILCNYHSIGKYVPTKQNSYFLNAPDGGVTLFTKDMFERCNGFSNLYIGWGREDSDFVRRNQIIRIPNEMIHLEHERNGEWKTLEFKRNDDNFKSGSISELDGFRQTTSEFNFHEIKADVFHCKISNIFVRPDYAYINRVPNI